MVLKRMDFKCEWDLPRYIDLEAVETDQRSMAIDTPNIGFFRKIKQQEAERGLCPDVSGRDEQFDWFQNHHHFVIYDKPTERQKQFFVERRLKYYQSTLLKEQKQIFEIE